MENVPVNIYKGKTVLITGHTGFKGSWLAIWLINLGAKVIGYALPPRTKLDNFVVCGLDKKIVHIEGDIRDYQRLLETFSKYKPEIVFHLAAQSLVLESYEDPSYTFYTNIMGTVNVLECVRKTPSVKVLICVTSDKCYENKNWVYAYRETDLLGGKDPYSASKAASEIVISSYLRSFFDKDNTANIASVRAGNTIGGGDWAENRLFPDCMRALMNNQPVIIRNPQSIRPWQHVLEPLHGYLTLASLLYTEGKRYSGAWNFGPLPHNAITVKQMVEEIIREWGSGEYIIEHNPEETLEASVLRLDISKAINELGWFPMLSIKEAIKFAIQEYKVDNLSCEEIFNQRIAHIEKYMQIRRNFYRDKDA